MAKIGVDSKDWIEMNCLNLYPKITITSKFKLNYEEFKNEKVQEAFERQNVQFQLFHAVQNELIDYLKVIDPNLWPHYINKRHPSNSYTILHEAARSKRPDLLEFILSKKPDMNIKSFKGYTALHLAVKSGNVECVTMICKEKKLEIDCQDRKGQTAVDLACRLNMIEIVKVLISYGANVQKTEFDGLSCLHHALRTNNLEMIELLLRAQCNPDVKDNNGISPIALAINHGYAKAFSLCVRSINNTRGSIALILNSVDSEGYSCVLNAVRHRNKEIFLLCIKIGADLTLRQNEGKTALHIASEIGWNEMIPILCESGIDINCVDNNLDTALHLAIYNGDAVLIESLLKNGAQVNICNRELLTPLLASIKLISSHGKDKFLFIMEMLLNANANIQIKNKKKQNILHLLINSYQIDSIKFLFQNISDQEKSDLINSPDENGDYPLHIACSLGLEEICIYLVKEGANILVSNNNESIPIHECTRKGNLEIVKFLIQQNWNQIYIKNEDETNLIQIAAQSGHYEIFEYLFDKEIDLHSKDENGNNILMSACQIGNIRMVELILTKDFNIHMKNYHKSSPLHVAASTGKTEMVAYLLKRGAELSENAFQQTPLMLALDNEHWSTARVFLNDDNWKKTMEFRFKNGKNHLEYVIISNEDIAYEFLNRGLTTVTDHNLKCSMFKYQLSLLDMGPYDSSSVNGRHHELMTIAKYKREKLMTHPLCIITLYRKWSRFGQFVWTSDFLLFLVFFVLLNFLIFHFTPPTNDRNKFNEQGCALDNSTTTSLKQLTNFDLTMKLVMFVLIGFRLTIELFKIYSQKIFYFLSMENYPFGFVYFLTLAFVSNIYIPPCQMQWSLVSIAVFIAWTIPMYYMQNIPVLGLPIHMFKNVFYSVLKIVFMFFNLMVGFTLAFYIINQNQPPFQSVVFSYVKTLVMLTGELDYVNYFFDPIANGFALVKMALMVTFVVFMPITMINLMIGIAVGDIDKMMDHAKLNMTILQINYVSNIESIMPKHLQSLFYEPMCIRIERKDKHFFYKLISRIFGIQENKPSHVDIQDASNVSVDTNSKRLESIEAQLEKIMFKLSGK